MNATGPYWKQVNIGLGNGLVPSGNKPLPETMLTQIYVCHHIASLGQNELKKFQFEINFRQNICIVTEAGVLIFRENIAYEIL